jgi:hypothetical protein
MKKYLPAIISFGLITLFFGSISKLNIVDLDLFHEMAMIRAAANTGKIPMSDLFSYIPTVSPVIHHEWGTGAILYFFVVQLKLGSSGLLLLKYLLTIAILAGIYWLLKLQNCNVYIVSFLSLLTIGQIWIAFTTIRAQLFTLLFMVCILLLIEYDRRGKHHIRWLIFPIFIIWVNLHAGFLVGLGIYGLYIIEKVYLAIRSRKNFGKVARYIYKDIIVYIAACFSLVINPYGIKYFPYLWNAITLDRAAIITEWGPLWEVSVLQFFLFIASMFLSLYALLNKKLNKMPGILILLVTAYLALFHYRHLSLFALAWIIYAPVHIQGTPLGDKIIQTWLKRHAFVALVFVAISLYGMFFSIQNEFWRLKIPSTLEDHQKGGPVYPTGAVEYLKKNNFVGNLMVPFDVGAYISWNLYPAVKVSMDSRFEVAYAYDKVFENVSFYGAAEGYENTIGKYPTNAILIPSWSKIKEVVLSDQNFSIHWKSVYSDGAYTIFVNKKIAPSYPVVNLGKATVAGIFP